MHAVLINAKDKTVTNVEVSETNTLKNWYKLLGCQMVEVATYLDNERDSILVDEEGLLSIDGNSKFFTFDGNKYAGNGLIVGVDIEGNSVSCITTADEVKDRIEFMSIREVRQQMKGQVN